MRIRKRSVPFPISSLSPVTLSVSDPQLNHTPLEQQLHQEHHKEPKGLHPEHHDNTHLHHQSLRWPKLGDDRQRSDLQLMIIRGRNGWVCSDAGERPKEKVKDSEELQGEEETQEKKTWRVRKRSTNIRKEISLGAEGVPMFSSSSHQVGRWGEGEKAFPLKKRRGSFERKVSEETIMEKEKKMKTKLKTKTNKKLVQVQQNDNGEEENARGDQGSDSSNVKKRGRGTLMEGSRCSRVNGRGWRCCQQTLVGYSLCEHHLGKGRLRSMSSVRSRTSAITRPKKEEAGSLSRSSSSSLQEKEQEHILLDEEEEDEEKPLMITKKRKKIGMVKARSLSSLLGQTSNAISTTVDNDYSNV